MLTITNTQEIFEIINTAKSMQFYAIANAAMALLINEAVKNEEFVVYLETQDSASLEQTYYDLLGVFDPGSGMRAVIPAPLVSNLVFCYLAKSGRLTVIEKIDHVREFVEPNFEEQQKLMKRLSALSPDVLSAISLNLQQSGEEDDCAKMVDLILTLETDDSPYFRFDLANKWKGTSYLRVA